MKNAVKLRNQYNLFFVITVLCLFSYTMFQTARHGGTNNFEENFYQKDFLIQKVNLLKLDLGDQIFPVALIGKNGWMEYTGEGTIDDIQNVRAFDNKEEIGEGIKRLNDYLKSQGISLIVVVAPNKATIYPDTLPREIKSLQTPSRLDALVSYFKENNLPMIDLRPVLQKASKDHDMYYKTDTHWNGYGALIAYTEILNSLHKDHPQLLPISISKLNYEITGAAPREITGMIKITSILEPGIVFTPKEVPFQKVYPGNYDRYDQLSWIPNSDLPILLMFHDSFGENYLDDYLSMNFSKSHFVHLAGMPEYLTKEAIQFFKPDVVIIEIVERRLQELPLFYPKFITE